jgi:3-oxoadipate enol-lactonase
MKIAFEEHGDGKPVILLHAFPLNRRMWEPQIEALISENCRVILPDLRGFGESQNFSDINTIEDSAQDIAELMDMLDIKRAIIGGLSMGGFVTFYLYKMFPEKFAGIILCDTHPGADTEEKRGYRFDLIEGIEKNGVEVLIDKMLPNLFSENTKTNRTVLVEKVEQVYRNVPSQTAIAALRGMAGRKDNTNLVNEISVPACLIFGDEDDPAILRTAEEMSQIIPAAKYFRIQNAGHYSNLEQPYEFNKALIEFVNTVEV